MLFTTTVRTLHKPTTHPRQSRPPHISFTNSRVISECFWDEPHDQVPYKSTLLYYTSTSATRTVKTTFPTHSRGEVYSCGDVLPRYGWSDDLCKVQPGYDVSKVQSGWQPPEGSTNVIKFSRCSSGDHHSKIQLTTFQVQLWWRTPNGTTRLMMFYSCDLGWQPPQVTASSWGDTSRTYNWGDDLLKVQPGWWPPKVQLCLGVTITPRHSWGDDLPKVQLAGVPRSLVECMRQETGIRWIHSEREGRLRPAEKQIILDTTLG